MKTASPKCCALSVCATAAMLAGCGGSAQLPNPPAATPLAGVRTAERIALPGYAHPGAVGSDSSSAEILIGNATVKCFGGPPGHGGFIVKRGTATGPYPGTFAANGGWTDQDGSRPWVFSESFTIKSGNTKISETISGSGKKNGSYCSTFGPNVMRYATTSGRNHKGKAHITIIQQGDFSETLLGL